MLDQDELRRRIKAARALSGTSVQQLADRIPEDRKLGERTLRKLESGEATIRSPHVEAIAAACDLPASFFTADFRRLDEISGDQVNSTSFSTPVIVSAIASLVRGWDVQGVSSVDIAARIGDEVQFIQAKAQRVDALERELDELRAYVETAVSGLGVDDQRVGVEVSRAMTDAAVRQADADDEAERAAARTRDASDASPEAPSTPKPRRRRAAGGRER